MIIYFVGQPSVYLVEFKMPLKIDINRLEKEELTYELAWRGIATGTVEEIEVVWY